MQNVSKNYSTENYCNQIKKLKRFGIHVFGLFLLGLDDDKPSDFDALYQFIQESGIVVGDLIYCCRRPRRLFMRDLRGESFKI